MDTRLHRYLRLVTHVNPSSPSIPILGALTRAEANALDNHNQMPTEERIAEIALAAGCTTETATNIFAGYLHKFRERIRFLPPT